MDNPVKKGALSGSSRAAAATAAASGNFLLASDLLQQTLVLEPGDADLWTNLAATKRALADYDGALAALGKALELNPRAFLALLIKGSLQERRGDMRQAAMTYGMALAQAPPADRLDGHTRRALERAREVNARHRDALHAHVRASIASRDRTSSVESKRVALFVETSLGIKRNFRQEPSDFFYPGLPAIEFYEREEFPWLSDLEAATAEIRDEAVSAIGEGEELTPYIAYAGGVPLDQWTELNHSPRWSAFHFHHFGERYEANCQRCPQTMQALAMLPQPVARGRMPAAMFSVLRPGTRIPPHTGVANVRLVLHLPLIVPPDCGFRVGNETRQWREGEAWVFDDTIEHEAWNLSTRDRIVMICDIWNPRISLMERDLITRVMTAMDEFNGFEPKSDI